jgi:hypothetical protein
MYQSLHNARLLPLNKRMGCLIALNPGNYEVFTTEASISSSTSHIFPSFSLRLTDSDIRALCTYGDNPLVVAKKTLVKTYPIEYPLRNKGGHNITEEKLICKLDIRLGEHSAIKVIHSGSADDIIALVCNRRGRIEAIKYGNNTSWIVASI